jgi:hypothetical protein
VAIIDVAQYIIEEEVLYPAALIFVSSISIAASKERPRAISYGITTTK